MVVGERAGRACASSGNAVDLGIRNGGCRTFLIVGKERLLFFNLRSFRAPGDVVSRWGHVENISKYSVGSGQPSTFGVTYISLGSMDINGGRRGFAFPACRRKSSASSSTLAYMPQIYMARWRLRIGALGRQVHSKVVLGQSFPDLRLASKDVLFSAVYGCLRSMFPFLLVLGSSFPSTSLVTNGRHMVHVFAAQLGDILGRSFLLSPFLTRCEGLAIPSYKLQDWRPPCPVIRRTAAVIHSTSRIKERGTMETKVTV